MMTDQVVSAPRIVVVILVLVGVVGVMRGRRGRGPHAARSGPAARSTVPAGTRGIAKTALAPSGVVHAVGEDWTRHGPATGATIASGTRVRVVGQDGLTLIVEAGPRRRPAQGVGASHGNRRDRSSPILFIVLVALFLFFAAIKIVNQYERLLIFTLGRTSPKEVKGPGWVFVVPIVQRGVRVDLREQFIEVPSQTSITKDNAPISIDFLIYWRIADPYKSVVEVQNFNGALQNIATTTLRAVIGDILLDDVLSKREQINEVLRVKLDEVTERWGGKVTTVEIREITPPRDVQDAMNRQLSAERTRRAVITESEGSPPVGDQRRRGHQAGRDPARRGRPPGGDPAGRGLLAGARADLPGGVAGRPEDDGAPVPRGLQGARAEPVDEVHPAARGHPARRIVPRVPRGSERAGRRGAGDRRTTPAPVTPVRWRRRDRGHRGDRRPRHVSRSVSCACPSLSSSSTPTDDVAPNIALRGRAWRTRPRPAAPGSSPCPEYLQFRGPDDGLPRLRPPDPGRAHGRRSPTSPAARDAWILVGSLAETSDDPARPYNTSVARSARTASIAATLPEDPPLRCRRGRRPGRHRDRPG